MPLVTIKDEFSATETAGVLLSGARWAVPGNAGHAQHPWPHQVSLTGAHRLLANRGGLGALPYPITRAFQGFSQLPGHSGAAMAHHQHVGAHRHVGACGVEQ